MFKRNNIPLLSAPQEQSSVDTNNEREEFQKSLRNGNDEPLKTYIDESILEKESDQPRNGQIVEEKGNEAK